MNYFTMAWWAGVAEDDSSDPVDDYWKYLAVIREKIPADLLILQESVSLHDTRLREMNISTSSTSLNMKLDGDDGKVAFSSYIPHLGQFQSSNSFVATSIRNKKCK